MSTPARAAVTLLGSTPAALRRRLVVAGAAAVLLPLTVVYTAASGFEEVGRLDEQSSLLASANHHRQNTESTSQAIRADVLESIVTSGQQAERTDLLQERVRLHIAGVHADMDALTATALPVHIDGLRESLDISLTLFAIRAEALVVLAATDPGRALTQFSALDEQLNELSGPQAALGNRLTDAAEEFAAEAYDVEVAVAVRTSVLAAAMWVALLAIGFVLHRVADARALLMQRVQENAATLASVNDQLEGAQSLAHLGSWEWNASTGRTIGSPEFYEILGLVGEQATHDADALRSHVHPDDSAILDGLEERVEQGQGVWEGEFRVVQPDGTVRDVHGRVAVERSRTGDNTRVMGTLQDVTDRRLVERMKAEFLAVISHELRTPLTSIKGALGLMVGGAAGALPTKAQRMAEVAVTSCDRLVRLINDILDVEKLTAGKLQLKKTPQAAAALIASSVLEMKSMADDAGITLVTGPVSGTVLADEDRIVQTLTNLVNNAIKFSPAGGVIEVAAVASEDVVLFSVTDQGRGIPVAKLEVIFDRFQQLDGSDTREQGGTGLGLAICRGIVEQHGGRIWATNHMHGVVFQFTLPRSTPRETPTDGDQLAVDDLRAAVLGGHR